MVVVPLLTSCPSRQWMAKGFRQEWAFLVTLLMAAPRCLVDGALGEFKGYHKRARSWGSHDRA